MRKEDGCGRAIKNREASKEAMMALENQLKKQPKEPFKT
jgi:hypothetical protein